MAQVELQLIPPGDGIALLCTPPFDGTSLDRGYVRGYPPGVRGERRQIHARRALVGHGTGNAGAGRQACFSLRNQIDHANTRAGVYRYKVEPYVVAADVHAVSPMSGAAANPAGAGRGVARASIDGEIIAQRPLQVNRIDDGGTHRARILLGRA
jgi:cyclic beta-1,2-glucan synthetase